MGKRIKAKSAVLLLVVFMTMTCFSFGVNAAGNGKWVEDSKGWTYQAGDSCYKNQWAQIGGKWYYFDSEGYMESSCYRDGYWLTGSGAWDPKYSHGTWKKNDTGWWYQDGSWYPKSEWLKINGKFYYFNDKGYMESSCYRDGRWLTSSGAWDTRYSNGMWKSNSTGKWYQDGSWYPRNQGLWIDGEYYEFDEAGYLKENNSSGDNETDIIELPFVPV